MNCLEIQDKIIDLIFGELEPQERILIEEHLDNCPSCAEDFALVSQCIQACQCPEISACSEAYWDDFVVTIHQKITQEKPKKPFPYRLVVLVAASVIGLVGIGCLLLFKPVAEETAKPALPEPPADPYQEVYELTPEEQEEFIRLINQRYYGE